MRTRSGRVAAIVAITTCGVAWCAPPLLAQQPWSEPKFEKHRLSDVFYCEGATFGDFNQDGKNDVVAGPYWYEGPDFTKKHELAAPKAFEGAHGYSDNFFAWTYDFDHDGWLDVFFVGFPGQRAWWAQNPGKAGLAANTHWTEHTVFDVVDNESPAFTDVNGDGVPDLVCINGGRYGYATFDPKDPAAKWTFHPISPDTGSQRFTHGLGVGDLNGDGKPDVLELTGWWEQPKSLAGDPVWTRHEFKFGDGHGGAQMLVYDVDGDGDADVVTSLNAHGYGLSWFEQQKAKDGSITFVEHKIMGTPEDKLCGDVAFSELHALALADVDGDGLPDVVTGKRFWAHGPGGTRGADDPAVLYWFKLVRLKGGAGVPAARFDPHLIDVDSGVGTQVVCGDVNGDGLVDVVVGNKKGAFVHLQKPDASRPAKPKPSKDGAAKNEEGVRPAGLDGRTLNTDFETGDLRDWTVEGDAFVGQPVRGDRCAARNREASLHAGEFWIGGYEVAGDAPTGTLTSAPFVVSQPFASFLIGGGASERTAVELVREGEYQAFFRCVGANYESMQRVVVDLHGELGRAIRVRLVDHERGNWGHLNFDDFRLYASRPSFERPPGVPAILEPDPIVHAGLAPKEAAAAMTVPPGFHVDLVAGEPDVVQPIAIAIDGRRRVWVAQATTYPIRAPEGEGKDSIVVFEDKDGDGVYETRTVFADHLNLVSGLEVGFGGVFVGAAPYLYFIPDQDDDLKPDGPPVVLLDGFGWGDTHETLNAFHWGPDGWLYGCHGVFTASNVGTPGTPDSQRVPMNAAIWRFHPITHAFEIFSEGTSNPWGVDFDDHGQAFCTACVIPHLYHCVQGGRYIRQAGGPFEPYSYVEIDTIADHRHYSGDGPYAAIGRSASVGGGHAHCGALMYLADQFPAEYRGSLLMGNIHGNRVNRDVFERDGSGFVGHHAPDFLVANDLWFRPVGCKLGPDGAVYFTDWYDQHACHQTPAELWNRGNGRVYRVSYGSPSERAASDARHAAQRDVAKLSDDELVRLQLDPNEWWVRQARKELERRAVNREGTSEAAVAALVAMATKHADATRRLRAMWALHAIGRFDEPLALTQLADPDEYVRAWTIQLQCESKHASNSLLHRMVELATSDPSPVVRLYLASALQRLPLDQRWDVAFALARHREDEKDRNLPQLVWYAIEPLVGADPQRALASIADAKQPALFQLRRLCVRRAAADAKCRDAAIAALESTRDAGTCRWMLEEIHGALRDQRGVAPPPAWAAAYARLKEDPYTDREALDVAIDFGDRAALAELRRAAANRGADVGWRTRAIDALVRMKDVGAVALLEGELDDATVRGAALRALATFDDPGVAAAVLARYASFDAETRRGALATLASRAATAKPLLVAIGRGDVARSDVSATVLRTLRELASPEVDALVKQHFGVARDSPEEKRKRIDELKAALTSDVLAHADKARGRAIFSGLCMKCHTLFGVGKKIAPDLTGANRRDLEYLLSNVVDPNAVIGKDYQVTNVVTTDQRIVSGIVQSENDSALTLVSDQETVTVAKSEIASRRPSLVSLMPEGQLDPLKPDEIRDLFAYLQSPAQTPLLATPNTLPWFFDGKSLAYWIGDPALWSVEDGEIVGRTREGIARNSFLLSELVAADFHLALEVKLVDDVGNSGVQFRSEPLFVEPPSAGAAFVPFEMKGDQADVGPGWWGKLYEESARGLLSEVSGEPFLKRGDWNRYDVWCTGSRVRTALNGHVTTDVDDPKGLPRGQFALQVHAGGPMEVRFRRFELELDPPALPPLPAPPKLQ